MKPFLALLLTLVYLQANSQTETVQQKHYNIKKNIVIEGYDAVSYFDGKPAAGKPEYRLSFKGVIYQFSSATNRDKFKASPEKYEPAYGGWCAYAMGETGEKVKIDPETYKIIEGKLYLFYNFWGNNTLSSWNKNEKNLKEAANRHWGKIVQ
jgi:YHS domain-containing protein